MLKKLALLGVTAFTLLAFVGCAPPEPEGKIGAPAESTGSTATTGAPAGSTSTEGTTGAGTTGQTPKTDSTEPTTITPPSGG